jgi:hypothetical protein
MSMFVTVDATIKVKLELLAASEEDGLAHAKAALPDYRLLGPSFHKRRWFSRLFDTSLPWDAALVTDVVSARVISSIYAGGE